MMIPIERSAPALLEASEVEAIRAGTFELRCPYMTIAPMADGGQAFTGSGTIKFDSNGDLSVSCISLQHLSPDGFMAIVTGESRPESGKLLSPAYLNRIEAKDFAGRIWIGEKFHPGINDYGAESGTHITGKLFEVNCASRNTFDTSNETAYVEFAGDYPVPTTTFADTIVDSGGEKIVRGPRDLLEFDTSIAHFKIHHTDVSLRVSASGSALSSVLGLETRITEALQFVLARPLMWSVFTFQTKEVLVARLRSTSRDANRYSQFPPVGSGLETASSFTTLFDKYLAYVTAAARPADRLHPVSALMRSVAHASASPLDASVLALSVAIEGLLQIVLADAETDISPDERKWIHRAQACVRTLPGPRSLRDRAVGALARLYQSSAKGRLDKLVAMKVIDASHRDAWQALRHKHAHGELVDSESIDVVLEHFYKSLVMFYRLVFYAIGYNGKYVDYGSFDWPISDMPQRDDPEHK